jgi:hypothetical protein
MTAPQTTPELLAIALLDEVAALKEEREKFDAAITQGARQVRSLEKSLNESRAEVQRLTEALQTARALIEGCHPNEVMLAVLAALRTAGDGK